MENLLRILHETAPTQVLKQNSTAIIADLSCNVFKKSVPHLLSGMSDAVGEVGQGLLNVLLHLFDLSQFVL